LSGINKFFESKLPDLLLLGSKVYISAVDEEGVKERGPGGGSRFNNMVVGPRFSEGKVLWAGSGSLVEVFRRSKNSCMAAMLVCWSSSTYKWL
jgi:hypothetical protein